MPRDDAKRTRVLLVDDSHLVRQSIKAMLEFESGEFEVVGEAENGLQALAFAAELVPDVILMDINMPDMDGITATAKLMEKQPVGVVIISVQGEQDYLRRAMKAGARDYLVKPFTFDELVGALRGAASHGPNPLVAVKPVQPKRLGKVITVYGARGGVGKTTVAANLAIGLAKRGAEKVAALDLDLEFGVLATVMGVRPVGTLMDLCRLDTPIMPDHVNRVLARDPNSGVGVIAAPPQPHLASEVDGDGRADRSRSYVVEVIEALRATHDYVVIDTASTFRDANLIAFDRADHIFIVTVPEIPALEATAKCLDLFLDRLEYPRDKVRVLLNRSDDAEGLSMEDIEASLGIPVAHTIPSDARSTATALNTGTPILLKRAKNSPIAEALQQLVELAHEGHQPEERPSPIYKAVAAASGIRRILGLF